RDHLSSMAHQPLALVDQHKLLRSSETPAVQRKARCLSRIPVLARLALPLHWMRVLPQADVNSRFCQQPTERRWQAHLPFTMLPEMPTAWQSTRMAAWRLAARLVQPGLCMSRDRSATGCIGNSMVLRVAHKLCYRLAAPVMDRWGGRSCVRHLPQV